VPQRSNNENNENKKKKLTNLRAERYRAIHEQDLGFPIFLKLRTNDGLRTKMAWGFSGGLRIFRHFVSVSWKETTYPRYIWCVV